MSHRQPSWQVKDEGSFASVRVVLPPGSSFHCESDAVVTTSQDVDVRGALSGGILAGLARAFLTRESFFTTVVRNTSSHSSGDVLIAPSDPGGVVLHHLVSGEEMTLTSGAYLAGDKAVAVASSMRSPFSVFGNYSGAGIFLLRASGRGILAICSYGSMHKYVLTPGERRNVDNGHLVAWSASMKTSMKLASRGAGVWGSVTSGEGLHCEFVGPGVVYVQSHKPGVGPDGRPGNGNGGGRGAGGNFIGSCAALLVVALLLLGFFVANYFVFSQPGSVNYGEFNSGHGSRQRQYYSDRYRKVEL